MVILVSVAYFLGTQKNSSKNSTDTSVVETEKKADTLIPKVGNLAPDFTLKDITGKEYSLSDYKDKKYVLVVFETTWCSWCAKERKDLDDLYIEAEDKIAVITIDNGESKQTVKQNIDKYDIKRPWLLDEKEDISKLYAANGTPNHFLIDKKGEIIWTRPGYATREILFELIDLVE